MKNTLVKIKCYNSRGNLYRAITTTFEQGDELAREAKNYGCWCTYDEKWNVYRVHGCQADINELLKSRIEK